MGSGGGREYHTETIRYVEDPKMKAEVEKLMKENNELKEIQKKIDQQYKDLEKQISKQTDPEAYDQAKQKIFDGFLTNVEKLAPGKKTEKFSFAMLGSNGVGKSSIINKIVGQKVTKTDVVDCTKDVIKVHENADMEVYDVPGSNDTRSYTNLQHILRIKKMHMILIVYQDRVEQVLNLIRLVNACHTELVVVRNKCEFLSQKQMQKIMNEEPKKVEESAGKSFPLFLVSAKTGLNLDKLTTKMNVPYVENDIQLEDEDEEEAD